MATTISGRLDKINFEVKLDEQIILEVRLDGSPCELREDGWPTFALLRATEFVLLEWGWPTWAIEVVIHGGRGVMTGLATSPEDLQLCHWTDVDEELRQYLKANARE